MNITAPAYKRHNYACLQNCFPLSRTDNSIENKLIRQKQARPALFYLHRLHLTKVQSNRMIREARPN